MSSPDNIEPRAGRAAVLPARVVYLIADGSEGELRRTVQEACTRWGGMTEPIVPVKPSGGFEPWLGQFVSLARVDAAVNVAEDQELLIIDTIHKPPQGTEQPTRARTPRPSRFRWRPPKRPTPMLGKAKAAPTMLASTLTARVAFTNGSQLDPFTAFC